jgi:hypothetical protein
MIETASRPYSSNAFQVQIKKGDIAVHSHISFFKSFNEATIAATYYLLIASKLLLKNKML